MANKLNKHELSILLELLQVHLQEGVVECHNNAAGVQSVRYLANRLEDLLNAELVREMQAMLEVEQRVG